MHDREDVRVKRFCALERRTLVCLLLAAGIIGFFGTQTAKAADSRPTVYVANSDSDTVSVLNSADAIIATIAVGGQPWSVAVSPDGGTAYVSNRTSGDVSVIDATTLRVRSTIPVGAQPCGLEVSQDGHLLYVDVYRESLVAVVDTRTDQIVTKISVGDKNKRPYGMAISPSGDTIYATNVDAGSNSSTVSVIDTRTNRLTATISGFVGATGVAVAPDGKTAWVTESNGSRVTPFDTSTNRIIQQRRRSDSGEPGGIAFAPDGRAVYVAETDRDYLGVIDPDRVSGIDQLTVGSPTAELAVAPDGSHVFATVFNSDTIADITTANRAVALVTVGTHPRGIAVVPGAGAGSIVASPHGVATIAGSLPRPSDAFDSTTTLIVSAAAAVGGIFFLTFPANLFNLTFHENYAAIQAWWMGLGSRFRRKRRRASALAAVDPAAPIDTSTPVNPSAPEPEHENRLRERVWFAFVVLFGALLGALLDPRFGANARTLDSFVAVVATVIVGAALPALVTAVYHRRSAGSAAYRLEALPGGLLIAAACVLVSRMSGFQPGYLYGVVAGVAFTRTLAKRQKGHVLALSTLTTLSVAIVAWFVWVPVDRIAEKPGAFAGVVIADDFLGSMFVGGLVGTVIGLLPLQFLPGWSLKEWHRGVWAALFAIASFGVVDFLLLGHRGQHTKSGSLVTTIVLFVLFAVGSVVFRDYFARKRRAAGGVKLRGFRDWLRDLVTPAPPVTPES